MEHTQWYLSLVSWCDIWENSWWTGLINMWGYCWALGIYRLMENIDSDYMLWQLIEQVERMSRILMHNLPEAIEKSKDKIKTATEKYLAAWQAWITQGKQLPADVDLDIMRQKHAVYLESSVYAEIVLAAGCWRYTQEAVVNLLATTEYWNDHKVLLAADYVEIKDALRSVKKSLDEHMTRRKVEGRSIIQDCLSRKIINEQYAQSALQFIDDIRLVTQ
jgi:hypothetical protein